MADSFEERARRIVNLADNYLPTYKATAIAATIDELRKLHNEALEKAAEHCETHVFYYRGNEPTHLVESETGDARGNAHAAAIRSMKEEG